MCDLGLRHFDRFNPPLWQAHFQLHCFPSSKSKRVQVRQVKFQFSRKDFFNWKRAAERKFCSTHMFTVSLFWSWWKSWVVCKWKEKWSESVKEGKSWSVYAKAGDSASLPFNVSIYSNTHSLYPLHSVLQITSGATVSWKITPETSKSKMSTHTQMYFQPVF